MPQDDLGYFDQAMALNGRGFAAGHYEAAFHALMAAFHIAQDSRDENLLRKVAAVADQQGRQIDVLSPPHRMSSLASGFRGRKSVYENAARQALAQANRIALKR